MFLGTYSHTVDVKGRVFVPSDFREELSGKFVIATTKDKCIKIYTYESYKRLREKISDMRGHKNVMSSRLIFRNASVVTLDSTGRILLPGNMRDTAEIKKNVTIIGCDEFAEIWDEELFNKYVEEEENVDEIMGYLEEDGIPS